VSDLPQNLRPLAIGWVVLLGAAVGSFLNVVIARVPAGLSVVRPRSRCPGCLSAIAWYDNLPVISWILLRGRCRSCGARISARYPLVETLGAAAALLAFQRHGLSGAAAAELAFAALLLALAFIDLDTWLLPHALTWPLIALGLLCAALGVAVVSGERPIGLVTRGGLLLRLARGFGQELYARKPVWRVAAPDPLLVAGDLPVAEAVALALARPPEALYDELIVVDDAGRYLGLLAAHTAHELRSPANAVVGVAELIRRHAERGAWHQVAERLPLLLRAATTLRATVNNVLDLSKLEAGRTEVALGPVELAPLLDDVAAMARLLCGEKPVAVVVEAEGLPPAVVTDGQKLRQIVLNLASNAAKFTEAGRVTIGAAVESGALRLWVDDTGIGIADEDLARLFVPFGQLEDARDRRQEGSGLGLVISRSLAQLLGGRVEVASRHHHGSTFTLHLPIRLPAPARPEQEAGPPP